MMTVSYATGDGILDVKIVASIELPDPGGTTALVDGTVLDPAVGTVQTVTGSPVTIPAIPASGSVYYVIQANTSTGAATMKQSTTAMPSPDPGNVVIFQQTLPSTATSPALAAATTPTTY